MYRKTTAKQDGRKRVKHTKDWICNKRKSSYAAGRAYTSKKGKDVQARIMKPACKCRYKCSEKIAEDERKNIFDAFWDEKKRF